jgi:adenosylhomocysteine nucleosidase
MGKKIGLFLVLLACLLAVSSVFAQVTDTGPKSRIGIMSAMDTEIDLLLANADIEYDDQVGGMVFHVGKLCGKDVVIVRAGIGKVLAAAGTAALFNRYDISSLIFTGVAGGLIDETNVLDMVIATDLVQHDFGTISDGINERKFDWSSTHDNTNGGFYPCDSSLVDLAYNAAAETIGADRVFKGTISTGDQFVASAFYVKELREKFDAIATEMEGAAVAAVCSQYDVPFVVLRSMSDKADGVARETYENFVDIAADNSCTVVMKMLENMK